MAVITFYFILLSLLFTAEIYSEETAEEEGKYTETTAENQTLFLFSEGAACSWLTRIIKQTERSNFVLEDFLLGLYFSAEMVRFNLFKPMIRIAAYYPMTQTFNKFPQKPKTPVHFGADMAAGVRFDLFDFKYVRLNLGPALHMFYLNSDRWNYFNLGAAAFVGIEVPVAKNWTVLLNGFASLDNGNLGGNHMMEPFDITYQYQIDIGVRYSKKFANKTFIFPLKSKIETEADSDSDEDSQFFMR